jgi:competence ComEA-like helix-hairpin-helix protein
MRRKIFLGVILAGALLSSSIAWGESPGSSESGSKININTADEAALATLPGIGKKGATAVIEYRTKNGPFKTVDDLKNVPGISELTVERLGERRLSVGEE